jgi:ubiquinone/menaquinone biosynthesis C-methylase UbiE
MLDKNLNQNYKNYVKNHFNTKKNIPKKKFSYLDAPFVYAEFFFFKHLTGKKVLDCGCGNGIITNQLSKFCKKIVGIDFSKHSILQAKHNILNKKKISFYIMDIHKLKFPKETFDFIICNRTLLYLNLDVALKEMSRVLKKNGKIIVIENLANNFIFNYYRYFKNLLLMNKFAKSFSTLKSSELKIIENFFYITQKKFFDFFSIGGFLLSKLFFIKSKKLSFFLQKIDNFLLNKIKFSILASTILLVLKKKNV